ncbi:hypothetical protein E4U55_007956, partial [Claviceps digitariae]
MAVASSIKLSNDDIAAPAVDSDSTLTGDLVHERGGSMSAGEDDKEEFKAVKHDEAPSSAFREVSIDGETDDDEYATGIKMFCVVMALVMGVFLLSLDM